MSDFKFFQWTPKREITRPSFEDHPSVISMQRLIELFGPKAQNMNPYSLLPNLPIGNYVKPGEPTTVTVGRDMPKPKSYRPTVPDYTTPREKPQGFTPTNDWLNSIGWNSSLPKKEAPQKEDPKKDNTQGSDNTKKKGNASTKHGSTDEIIALQKRMKAAGYDLGKFGAAKDGVDGKWGKYTQAAYEAYRKDQELENAAIGEINNRMPARVDSKTNFRDANPQGVAKMFEVNKLKKKKQGGNIEVINNLIQEFKKGGGINIKPENKGKFTATKKKTGKTTEELTHSKNPITKKRAIFAQNAKKWKHKDGGHIEFINELIDKFQVGGTIKSYDNSLKANIGRAKGKFREVIPESWRTILPGFSDAEDAVYLQEAFSPQGTVSDKVIATIGGLTPWVTTKFLRGALNTTAKSAAVDNVKKEIIDFIEKNDEGIKKLEIWGKDTSGKISPKDVNLDLIIERDKLLKKLDEATNTLNSKKIKLNTRNSVLKNKYWNGKYLHNRDLGNNKSWKELDSKNKKLREEYEDDVLNYGNTDDDRYPKFYNSDIEKDPDFMWDVYESNKKLKKHKDGGVINFNISEILKIWTN